VQGRFPQKQKENQSSGSFLEFFLPPLLWDLFLTGLIDPPHRGRHRGPVFGKHVTPWAPNREFFFGPFFEPRLGDFLFFFESFLHVPVVLFLFSLTKRTFPGLQNICPFFLARVEMVNLYESDFEKRVLFFSFFLL